MPWFSKKEAEANEATIQWLIDGFTPRTIVAESLLSALKIERTPLSVLEAGMLVLIRNITSLAIATRGTVYNSDRNSHRIQKAIRECFLGEFAAIAWKAGLNAEALSSLCSQRVLSYLPVFDEYQKATLEADYDGQALIRVADVGAAALTGSHEGYSVEAYGLLTWIGHTEVEMIKVVKAKLNESK